MSEECVHHKLYSKDQTRVEQELLGISQDVSNLKLQIGKGEQRLIHTEQRLDDVEQQNSVIQDLVIGVNSLVIEIKHLVHTVATHDEELKEIKGQPSSQLREAKLILLGAFAGAVLSAIFTGMPWLIKQIAGG